jgi:hypothetical protein
MNNLTEDDRKVLTELIGECCHTYHWYANNPLYRRSKCHFYVHFSQNIGRTFATMILVKDKIVEMGKWGKFRAWAYNEWQKDDDAVLKHSETNDAAFKRWFFTPTTFNRLAAEWWKKEKGGGGE